MKTKIIQILFITLIAGVRLFGQNTYQTFPSAGFKVKCGCKLYVNKLFIEMAKQQGINNILAAYICAENEVNRETGTAININVYDDKESYSNISAEHHAYFEKKCLEAYVNNLENAGINHYYTTFQGVRAVEYNFMQYDLPTKAIMFYKNKKSYLLQVGTRDNLTTKFNALKTSFVLF
jgi:hypothetical protein